MANEKRLIDANALSDSFEKAAYKCERIEDMVFHLDYILDEITGADEVDAVEVVHGRWRLETDEEEPNLMFKLVVCSVCGKTANGMYNYCPNCGANMMDGGNEDV